MCDMIPFSEHWRVSLAEAQDLQHGIMGYLPGFATPRIVCDVPFVGKRWVHQLDVYDRGPRHLVLDEELPHRRSSVGDAEALTRTYPYYDPIDTLPERGPGVVARARGRRRDARCEAPAAAASRGVAAAPSTHAHARGLGPRLTGRS